MVVIGVYSKALSFDKELSSFRSLNYGLSFFSHLGVTLIPPFSCPESGPWEQRDTWTPPVPAPKEGPTVSVTPYCPEVFKIMVNLAYNFMLLRFST